MDDLPAVGLIVLGGGGGDRASLLSVCYVYVFVASKKRSEKICPSSLFLNVLNATYVLLI